MEPSTMLEQKVSPVEEEAMGPSPKKRCTEDKVADKSLEAPVKVKEEGEKPDKMEPSTMLEQKVSPVEEEAMGPSPKKRCTEDKVADKSLEAPVKVKEEDATDNQEAQVGMTEGDSKSPTVDLQKCNEKQLKSEAEDEGDFKSPTVYLQKCDEKQLKSEAEDEGDSKSPTVYLQKCDEKQLKSEAEDEGDSKSPTVHLQKCDEKQLKSEAEDEGDFKSPTVYLQKCDEKQLKSEAEDEVDFKSPTVYLQKYDEKQLKSEAEDEGDFKSPTVYLQKCDEKQLKSEAEDDVLPSPQDPLPDGALHIKEDDNVEAAEESVSLDHSASTANAPATSSLAISCYVLPLSPDEANQEIKYALMAEIRRYGRHYGRIFELLEEVQGPLEVQIQFVKFAIKEAARFKRYHLISYLDEMLDKLMSESTIRGNLNLSA